MGTIFTPMPHGYLEAVILWLAQYALNCRKKAEQKAILRWLICICLFISRR
jgi:hypothetical protein